MGLSRASTSLVLTLAGASAVSLIFYLFGVALNHGSDYYYLIWNLFLAWLPLAFAYLLIKYLHSGRLWSSWRGLALTFLWLVFLPNSFYLISDFVHLFDITSANITYNIAMLGSFAFDGLALGFLSLWAVHRQLIDRGHSVHLSWSLVGLVLLIASYAVYLGRYIRLNSWDVFTNFSSVLFSVSDQLFHPSGYPAILGVTLSFFLLLATIYVVVWRLAGLTNIIEANERRNSR